jgi:[ribosomal protein S5]-alanine N-acetyltransferase
MNRPPFTTFPELGSARLLLQELQPGHAAFMLDIMVYNGKPAKDIADALSMIDRIGNDYRSGNTVNWVMVERETLQPIGTIGYYRGFANVTGEIGFVMKPEYHGNGYMTEALQQAVQFGQEVLELDRIIAVTKLTNRPAVHLLERVHFRYKCPVDDEYSEFVYIGPTE